MGSIDFECHSVGQGLQIDKASLGMRGPHQAANAAVALAAVCELRHQGWWISTEAMCEGLERAVMPGRVEVLPGEPTVVLDTAHNPASAQALVEALAELPAASRRTLILSISHDKDVAAIVRELAAYFDRVVVTQYRENPRAVAAEKLLKIVEESVAGEQKSVMLCHTPQDAWNHVVSTAAGGELVCIAGSFYLTAEMRPLALLHATSTTAATAAR
jgi:dihydrofolate synthase/folylpolyglutamate synthase